MCASSRNYINIARRAAHSGFYRDAIFTSDRAAPVSSMEVIGCLYLRKTPRPIRKSIYFASVTGGRLVCVNLSRLSEAPKISSLATVGLRLYRNPLTRYYRVSLIRVPPPDQNAIKLTLNYSCVSNATLTYCYFPFELCSRFVTLELILFLFCSYAIYRVTISEIFRETYNYTKNK